MYLEQHVFQVDIAKYFKVSAALVSRLVKEAQEDPQRNFALRKQKKEELERRDAVKKVVTSLLLESVPIVKADTVATLAEQQEENDEVTGIPEQGASPRGSWVDRSLG